MRRYAPYCLPYRGRSGSDFAVLLALTAIALLIPPTCLPQECAGCAVKAFPAYSEPASEWSLKKQVNEVNVLFVAARGGRFVDNLLRDDVTVRDDNKAPAAILGFRTEKDLPLRVALLVDTSNSLTSRFRFERAAASSFLRHSLPATGDLAFVMGFSDQPTLMQDFTHDADLLTGGVERLKIGGGTALYDAVAAGCQRLLLHPDRDVVARVLVVLSDGQNNAGSLRLENAIDAAQRAEVVVYTISTHYPSLYDNEDLSGIEGNKNLRKLAEQTGGRVLVPANPKEIEKAFEKINDELRSRYAISYRPADFTTDNRYRKITIEARQEGKKLQIRARKGYYARSPNDAFPSSPDVASVLVSDTTHQP